MALPISVSRLASRLGIRRRIAGEGAWVAGGQLVSAVAALVSVRIMTELLTPEEFGRLALLVGIVALALGLAAAPRLQAMIRYYPDAARDGRIATLRATGIQMIVPMVALAAALLAGFWLVAGPRLDGARFTGFLIAALLAVDCLRSFELSLFNAARRQKPSAAIYAADAWSRPLMAIICVLAFGASAEAALAGYVAGSAIVVLAMRLWMRLEGIGRRDAMRGQVAGGSEDLAALIRRYAWPLAPLAIFGWLSGVGDRYVIAGMLSLHDAGLYAAVHALVSRPFLISGSLLDTLLRPYLYEAVSEWKHERVRRVAAGWAALSVTIGIVGIICFMALHSWAARILLSDSYWGASQYMPWIAVGYALTLASQLPVRICYACERTYDVFWIEAVLVIATILVMIPAVSLFGLYGAAIAVPVYRGIHLIFGCMFAVRAIRSRKYLQIERFQL